MGLHCLKRTPESLWKGKTIIASKATINYPSIMNDSSTYPLDNSILTNQPGRNKSGVIRLSAISRWILLLAVLILPQVVQAQWNATVGAQSNDKGDQALAFLPNEIWIHAADRITWTFDADDIIP